MATKKCPKCGEENPAEAVMCWACYTPLAGGAAAAAGGGLVTPRGGAASVAPAATGVEEEGKKSVDPKIFVIVGLLVAAAVIGSFTTGLIGGGGSGGDAGDVPPDVAQMGEVGGTTGPPPPPVTNTNSGPPTLPSFPNPEGGAPVAPQFRTVVPPNPRQKTGTMGIMVTTPGLSPAQAMALAKFAKQSFESGGKWGGMQVVVFNDPAAAKTFLKYQAQRKGARLTPYEYQELANQGLWNSVPAYYETRGKQESQFFPASNGKNWWSRQG